MENGFAPAPMANGLPEAAVAVVGVMTKLARTGALLPTTTGEPVGWTPTAVQLPEPRAMGLNGNGVRTPVAWLTAKTLSVLLPSLTANTRPPPYTNCSDTPPGPPFPPVATGNPGRAVNAPVARSRRKP